jgi:ribulose kinase
MLAGVGAGLFPDLPAAAAAMVHTVDVIQPDHEAHQAYQYNYQAYLDTYPVMQGLMDKMTRHLNRS